MKDVSPWGGIQSNHVEWKKSNQYIFVFEQHRYDIAVT